MHTGIEKLYWYVLGTTTTTTVLSYLHATMLLQYYHTSYNEINYHLPIQAIVDIFITTKTLLQNY